MKTSRSLLIGSLCAVLLGPPAISFAAYNAASPTASYHHHHGDWAEMFKNLHLSQQQQDQIHTLVADYRQAHPEGSQPDEASRKALWDQILAVLTPEQRAQLEQETQARRDQQASPAATPSP